MTTFTLAHLSDVHIGVPPAMQPGERNLKRMIGYFNWDRRRRFMHDPAVADRILADMAAQAPDHIAFTGDYANVGLAAELSDGARWIARLGLPATVSVVPGNHDIYSARGLGPDLGLGAWAPYMRGDASGVAGLPLEAFPYVRRLGPIAIVGVNSSVPTPPFLAIGRVGERQLEGLAHILAELGGARVPRVVLIHHPPLPGLTKPLRNLTDAPRLASVLTAAGAELVLYGHNHRDTLVWHAGPGAARIPVVGVASASLRDPHGRQPRARYNLFRFMLREPGRVRIEMTTRGLLESGDAIGEIARRILEPAAAGSAEAMPSAQGAPPR